MAKLRKQLMIIVPMILMLLFFCKIDVSAHDAYFIAVVVDENTHTYHGEIIHETGKNHREVDVGGFSKCISKETHQMSEKIPEVDYNSDKEPTYPVDKKGTNDILYFTFPSVHSQGWFADTVDASGQDLALAQRVLDYPLAGLNDALSFILSETGWTSYTGSKTAFETIGRHLGNYDSSFEVQVGSDKYTITLDKDNTAGDVISDMGIKAKDYCSISVNGGKPRQFIYRCKKGYYGDDKNDPLYYMTTSRYDKFKKKAEDNGDVKYVTWKMLVMQGNYNADINTTTYSSIENVATPNEFSTIIGGFFTDMINSIRSALGLYSINELMVNGGSRDHNYTLGMYPSTWSNAAILLHIICQMIAWGCIGFSVLQLVHKRQLATMNIVQKVSWQESIKNLILCGFLLASFTLVFNFCARLNYRLVDLFGASTNASSFVNIGKMTATGTFGQITIAAAVLILTIYFNFFYYLRAITIAILYGLAPLAIYTLSLGGKMTGTFTNFLKELLGNIFIQAVHAILLAFFCNVTVASSPRAFEMLVILYAFIPLSKFIKEKVFGMGGGIADATSGLMRTAGSVAGGFAGGLMGAKAGSKGGAKGPSGGATERSTLDQSLDAPLSLSKGSADVTLKDQPSGKSKKFGDAITGRTVHAGNPSQKISTFEGDTPIAQAANTIKSVANTPGGQKTIGMVASGGKAVLKGAGNLAIGSAMVGAGAVMSAVDPSMGSKFVSSGAGHLGNIKNNIASVPREIQANNNFRDSMQYNGVSSMTSQHDFTKYQVAGKFNSENNQLDNPNMSVDQRKEYEAMYKATKNLKDNKLDDSDKIVLKNMNKNQVRMDIGDDNSATIVRRSADINKLHNPADRANPLAGTSKIRDRSDNREIYSYDGTRTNRPANL